MLAAASPDPWPSLITEYSIVRVFCDETTRKFGRYVVGVEVFLPHLVADLRCSLLALPVFDDTISSSSCLQCLVAPDWLGGALRGRHEREGHVALGY